MIAEANGIQLNYEQRGNGDLDLLLVPGLGAGTWVWEAQMERLSPYARVTAVDLRGHGESGKPAGPYSIRQFADDLSAFVKNAGLFRPIVVGSSMGAMVAIEFAAAYPYQVSGLVLVGGFPKLGSSAQRRMLERAELTETQGMAAVAEMVAQTALGRSTHENRPELVQYFTQQLAKNDPRAYAAACRAIAEADVNPSVGQIRDHALVVMGSEEQVAPVSAARGLLSGLRHSSIEVIPSAGHLPFLEQPAAFNAAVFKFLCTLPPPT